MAKEKLCPGCTKKELHRTVRNLDPMAKRLFEQAMKDTKGDVVRSLHVVVNTVKGNVSQLSEDLRKFSEKQGWLEEFERAGRKEEGDVEKATKEAEQDIDNEVDPGEDKEWEDFDPDA